MIVKIQAQGVEDHRIELEPSSFAQGGPEGMYYSYLQSLLPLIFFLIPITPYPLKISTFFGYRPHLLIKSDDTLARHLAFQTLGGFFLWAKHRDPF